MSKEKVVKTNAMRMLDKMKIEYEVVTADITSFVSGTEMARLENVSPEESFSTACGIESAAAHPVAASRQKDRQIAIKFLLIVSSPYVS